MKYPKTLVEAVQYFSDLERRREFNDESALARWYCHVPSLRFRSCEVAFNGWRVEVLRKAQATHLFA